MYNRIYRTNKVIDLPPRTWPYIFWYVSLFPAMLEQAIDFNSLRCCHDNSSFLSATLYYPLDLKRLSRVLANSKR